jgi:hypothetical protein
MSDNGSQWQAELDRQHNKTYEANQQTVYNPWKPGPPPAGGGVQLPVYTSSTSTGSSAQAGGESLLALFVGFVVLVWVAVKVYENLQFVVGVAVLAVLFSVYKALRRRVELSGLAHLMFASIGILVVLASVAPYLSTATSPLPPTARNLMKILVYPRSGAAPPTTAHATGSAITTVDSRITTRRPFPQGPPKDADRTVSETLPVKPDIVNLTNPSDAGLLPADGEPESAEPPSAGSGPLLLPPSANDWMAIGVRVTHDHRLGRCLGLLSRAAGKIRYESLDSGDALNVSTSTLEDIDIDNAEKKKTVRFTVRIGRDSLDYKFETEDLLEGEHLVTLFADLVGQKQ